MATSSNLDLLRRLRDATARVYELERADLDRRIKALDRVKPAARSTQLVDSRDHERELIRVLQASGAPLPARELAQRLNTSPKTVWRWLAAAQRRGFVERVVRGLYQVREEVPTL